MHINLNLLELSAAENVHFFKDLSADIFVCLWISDARNLEKSSIAYVQRLLESGCGYFMIWGKHARSLEDEIDFVIESHGEKYLDVVTVSESDLPTDEMAWELLNVTLSGHQRANVLILHDGNVASATDLAAMIRSQVSGA